MATYVNSCGAQSCAQSRSCCSRHADDQQGAWQQAAAAATWVHGPWWEHFRAMSEWAESGVAKDAISSYWGTTGATGN